MKVVINDCFGGFNLSAEGIKRYAELKGKECYFFDMMSFGQYKPITLEEASKGFFFVYSVLNPQDYRLGERDEDGLFRGANKRAEEIGIKVESRSDPDLIKVVEELGDKANGKCAHLKIVEIPDGTEYTIEEYDGNEHIAESHQTWS